LITQRTVGYERAIHSRLLRRMATLAVTNLVNIKQDSNVCIDSAY
jgi:hypothetical protein